MLKLTPFRISQISYPVNVNKYRRKPTWTQHG